MSVSIVVADYSNPVHSAAVVELLDHYARDDMGGGQPLTEYVRQHLVRELQKRDFAFSILALVDDIPAGLANCFEGFSTFACRPLVNIHDLAVHKDFRGKGLSHRLLQAVEDEARRRGCIKVTLEVLSNNTVAVASYKKFGFEPYQLDPQAGPAQFWQKYVE